MARKMFPFLDREKKNEKIRVDVKGYTPSSFEEQERLDTLNNTVEERLQNDKKQDKSKQPVYAKPYIKEKGEEWKPDYLRNVKGKETLPYSNGTGTIKIIPTKKRTYCKLIVVCIEITYDIDKIKEILNSIWRTEKEVFIRFIIFSNKVYKTDILFFGQIRQEDIMKIIIKEKFSNVGNDNIVLYDALLDTVDSEQFMDTKKVSINEDYFISEIKYIFILSGNEQGSKRNKKELLEKFSKVRKSNPNLNVICTDRENLVKVSSIGFRKIVITNLQ